MDYDILSRMERREQRLSEMSDDFRNMVGAIEHFKEKYNIKEITLVMHPSGMPVVRAANAPYHTPKLTDSDGYMQSGNIGIRFGTFKTATVLGE